MNIMDKQASIEVLRDALNESKAVERKINNWLRDQNIQTSYAPYGLVSALTQLERFRDEIRNAICDLSGREREGNEND